MRGKGTFMSEQQMIPEAWKRVLENRGKKKILLYDTSILPEVEALDTIYGIYAKNIKYFSGI